jgi:hypothetical protein
MNGAKAKSSATADWNVVPCPEGAPRATKGHHELSLGFQPQEPSPQRRALKGRQRTRPVPSNFNPQNREDVRSLTG